MGGDLPNPGVSSLGGVQSFAQVANQFLTQISTSGVVSSAQPSFANLSGNASLAQLPLIGNNTILSNISGGSATPLANSISSIIDSSIASTQGDILYRNGTIWTSLPPGTSGQVLSTGGAAANPSWTTVSGTGTVTSVATNNGLAGGPVTSSGTIGLATIATGNVLAYTGAGSGVPVATGPSAVLDVIGSTEGDILYRGASNWSVLAPGTSGQFLQTPGAGSTPSWASAVTSVGAAGLATGGPITSTGTITVTAAVKANQTTATSTTVAVVPGVQQFHPSAAKAWGYVTFVGATATLQASYNVTSFAVNSTGLYTITFTVPFASANYACVGATRSNGTNINAFNFNTQATGSVIMANFDSGTLANPLNLNFVCFGTE